ncbi:MAG TPA: sugar kinase [Candidatus Dorea gallistercoris]|uniref:Sugar kinase n=1 Tax=Candidatus Dorea gallistercoris TaxID=2838542 RepID=A0A9D1UDH9_9FIRM|nr:sugar kinase [Candidatus Dorea gallistercoris]
MAITIIGAAIIDILARPVDGKVFEQGSWPVQDMRMDIGGDAANEALVLSGLGKKVYLQTVLGEDMTGRMILKRLRERGVCVSGSCVSRDMVTGINTVLIQEDGERSFLTNPNGSLRKLGMEHIHIPFEEDTEILCLASIFVSPLLTVREMEQIFSAAKSQGITVCADMTKCKNQETAAELAPAFRYVDYLLPNEAEAKLLTRKNSVEEAAKELQKAGVSHVVIKCGKKGCYVAAQRESFWAPAKEQVQCVDTTGAGDSFAGGFLAALSEGRSIRECAEFANQCGAKAVSAVGATAWL